HTIFSRDWSSDVCSSDLVEAWLAKHAGPVLPEPVHVPTTPQPDAVYAPREPVVDLALGVVLADPSQPEPAPAGRPKHRGRRLLRDRKSGGQETAESGGAP